ncbi:MAG: glucuronate isomerase [Oscillospiraceae bacterium]|nr:glucuronate isomerase [Oscillospiraceae bacterium]
MTSFMNEDFLLTNDTARQLYHNVAKYQPIVDYHCHLNPQEIYQDVQFANITQLWLGGDHYKWRILRSNGVDEYYITGTAPDREKFQKFAETLPRCIGNPMYHWCHLELKNFFGYEGTLNAQTAQEVWDLCNAKLATPEFSARNLIRRSNVTMVGTTDDPCSDLKWHKLLAQTDFETKVCPSFRPDPALNCHKAGFADYIAKLSEASGIPIQCAADVAKALTQRIEYFHSCGCCASDHGLDYVMYRMGTDAEIEDVFRKAMAGAALTTEETEIYQTYLLLHCGRDYARLGWVMQLHFSCFRNPNSRMFSQLGADTGFDCIAVTNSSAALHRLMDAWDSTNQLPKTILYSLNPADDQWLDTLLGAYQGTEVPGKIQHGSAWWFNDNRTGMVNQMTSLANLGILGNFIGMLTDSRSFLSYARHEYFRRILCNLIGTWVENGEYPADMDTLGDLVADISCRNAMRYFNL